MPSIGAVTFLEQRGDKILRPMTVVQDVTRPRVTGHAWRDMGVKSEPVVWEMGVDVDDPEFFQLLLESMQGEIVDVVDVDGTDTEDVMIIKVQIISKKNNIRAVGGVTAGLWWIEARFLLQGS